MVSALLQIKVKPKFLLTIKTVWHQKLPDEIQVLTIMRPVLLKLKADWAKITVTAEYFKTKRWFDISNILTEGSKFPNPRWQEEWKVKLKKEVRKRRREERRRLRQLVRNGDHGAGLAELDFVMANGDLATFDHVVNEMMNHGSPFTTLVPLPFTDSDSDASLDPYSDLDSDSDSDMDSDASSQDILQPLPTEGWPNSFLAPHAPQSSFHDWSSDEFDNEDGAGDGLDFDGEEGDSDDLDTV